MALVLAESLLVTSLGAVLGMLLAWWIGVQFEPLLSQYVPGFRVPASAFLAAAGYVVALGGIAGAMPAWQAMRLRIVEALRRE